MRRKARGRMPGEAGEADLRQVETRFHCAWALLVIALIVVQPASAQASVPRPAYLDHMPTVERIAAGARAS